MKLTAAVLPAAVGAAIALWATRERKRDRPALVCRRCGETMPIGDVLDPAETCACSPLGVV